MNKVCHPTKGSKHWRRKADLVIVAGVVVGLGLAYRGLTSSERSYQRAESVGVAYLLLHEGPPMSTGPTVVLRGDRESRASSDERWAGDMRLPLVRDGWVIAFTEDMVNSRLIAVVDDRRVYEVRATGDLAKILRSEGAVVGSCKDAVDVALVYAALTLHYERKDRCRFDQPYLLPSDRATRHGQPGPGLPFWARARIRRPYCEYSPIGWAYDVSMVTWSQPEALLVEWIGTVKKEGDVTLQKTVLSSGVGWMSLPK